MNEYKNIKVREVNYGFGYVMDGDVSTLTSDNVLTKLDYQFKKLKEQLKQTQEKLKIATKALEYYADPENYNMDSSYIENDDELISYNDILDVYEFGDSKKYPCQDYVGGKRARKALKEIDKCGQ